MVTVARLSLQVDVDGGAESIAQLEAIDRALRRHADRWSQITSRVRVDVDEEGNALMRLGRTSEEVHTRIDRDVNRSGRSHGRFGGVLGVVSTQMTRMATRAGIVTQALIPLAVAGFQVGSALTPIVGLAGALPGLLLAGGVAAGTARLAFSGMSDALKAMSDAQDGSEASARRLREAMDALPPAARPVVRQLFEMRTMVTRLRETAAAGIMPGVSAVLTSLRGLFPIVRREIGETAGVMGRLAQGTAAWAASPMFRRDFQTVIGTSSRLTSNFGNAALQLARAFMDVAVVGQPLVRQFGALVEQGARWAAQATASARASGSMAAFFRRAGDTAEILFGIVADLVVIFGNLGRAAAPAGQGLLQTLASLLDRAARATQNIELLRARLRQLGDAFTILRGAMLGVAFGPWGAAVGALAGVLLVLYRRSETFRNVVNQIGSAIARVAVPAFRSLVGWVQGQFLPAIMRVVPFVRDQLAAGFDNISRALGRNRGEFQQFGRILLQVASWVLTRLVPVLIQLTAVVLRRLMDNIAAAIRIFGFLVRAVGTVVGAVRATASAIGAFIEDTRQEWNTLVATTQGAFARVREVIGTVGRAIVAAWNTVLGITRAVWGFIRANVFDNIARVRTEVLRAIGGLIPRSIREGWNTAARWTSQGWSTMWRTVGDFLGRLRSDTGRTIGSLIPRSIREGWNSASRSTSEAWRGIRNTVSDGTRRAMETISGWGRAVRGFFGRMISSALSWGRDIWRNLRSGIGQVDLRAFIRDRLNAGIRTINNFARGVASFGNRILPGSPLKWTDIPQLRQMGGLIERRQTGGLIPGMPRGDNVPVLAEGGEVMIRQPVAEPLQDFLLAINRLPASTARAIARELRGAQRPDIGGDTAMMVLGRQVLNRPDRQGTHVRLQRGGVVPPGGAAQNTIPTGLVPLVVRTQQWIRAQDPKPYVWGGVGPYGYDCSGIAGSVYALLTGQNPHRRYFTTGSIGGFGGLRPGRGAYTIGVTAGAGHMAGNLAGLRFEARSRASGILVGAAARAVESFARQYYLPRLGGQFTSGGGGFGALLAAALDRLVNTLINPARRRLQGMVSNDDLTSSVVGGIGLRVVDSVANFVRSLFTAGFGGGGAAAGGPLSPAERWIIMRESGGRTTADNPTSTAFGLGQLLLANRIHYGRILGVSPNTTDYNAQLAMFRMYVRDRYQTAERAMQFWRTHGWYQSGLDTIVRRPTLIGVGEAGPERVTVTPGSRSTVHHRGGDTYNFNVELNGTYAEPITRADVDRSIARALGMLRAAQAKAAGVGRA